MEQVKYQLLIDYLDENLNEQKNSEVAHSIQHDTNAASEIEYLKLAIETVRLNAIKEKVSAVRNSISLTKTNQASTGHGIVRNMYKISLRIAAIFILLLASAVLYKYMSVTSQSVYKNQFIPYDLSNTRGVENRNPESEAYNNKNWNMVVELNNATPVKSNKSNFLAAMADMQLNHYSDAIELFQNILNNRSENSYQEEAEYYCALAYLMDQKVSTAIGMFNKIKSDPNHRYYPLASKISGIDLKIIDLKK
jgi:TolA-binding protein